MIAGDFLGPGQYSMPSTLDRKKAFSFGLKVNRKVKNEGPSPNSYQSDRVDFAHKPAYSFGSRYEPKSRSDTPGIFANILFTATSANDLVTIPNTG